MNPVVTIHHGNQLNAIESLRGVAALMVLLYHVAEFMKLPPPASLGFISTHFGQGVPLFYTLSGFVLAYGYADRLDTRRDVVGFYVRRLFRIMPLFYAMLAIWLAVNYFVWHKTFGLDVIFLNATFLFGLVPGEHDSIVWAGWSIGIEMLFYLTFPIVSLLTPNVRASLISFGVVCILSNATQTSLRASGLNSFAYMNLVTHLPYFVAGIASFRIWQRLGYKQHWTGWVLFGAALLMAVMLVDGTFGKFLITNISRSAYQNAWAITFSLLIISTCLVRIPALDCGPLRHLGKVSFSFYLLHPLVLLGFIKIKFVSWLSAYSYDVAMRFLLGSLVALAVIWAISFVTFRTIEVPGIALGRRVALPLTRDRATA